MTSQTENTTYYKDYPEREQPENRIAEHGPRALSTSELFAVALGIKTPRIAIELAQYYSEVGSLGRMEASKLSEIEGVGPHRINVIQAIHELARRDLVSDSEKKSIHSPEDAASLVQYEMGALEQEQLRIILLDTRHHVIKIVTVYQGSANSAQVRVADLFKIAVRENAISMIVVHNHPSGDPTPSPDDVSLTRALVQAGKLMDLDVLDHLVIGKGRFVSLKEKGLGF